MKIKNVHYIPYLMSDPKTISKLTCHNNYALQLLTTNSICDKRNIFKITTHHGHQVDRILSVTIPDLEKNENLQHELSTNSYFSRKSVTKYKTHIIVYTKGIYHILHLVKFLLATSTINRISNHPEIFFQFYLSQYP